MYKIILASILFVSTQAMAQKNTKVYTTKYIPSSVTYNASPDKKECWKARAEGLEIETGSGSSFFDFNNSKDEKLKEKIGTQDVKIEVSIYDKPNEYNAEGHVLKITLNGEVIYPAKK